jgi:hypothetical protein
VSGTSDTRARVPRFDTSFLTEEFFRVQQRHRRRMQQLLSGRQPGLVPTFEYAALELPLVRPYRSEQWLEEQLEHLRRHIELYCDPVTWRVPAFALRRYGLHFTSAVLGCPIRAEAGRVWCTPLSESGRSPADFRAPDLDHSVPFQEMLRLVRLVADATDGRLPIELPFLAAPLLAAVELYGSDFLVTLAEDDGLAERVLKAISDTVLAMRLRLQKAVDGCDLWDHHTCACPMPNGYRFLYGCTTQLVSAQTYRRHIAELDASHLAHRAQGGCIHLCGGHTQHLGTWRSLEQVRAVQLNDTACQDFETYWRGLRPDQFVVLWPCEHMTVAEAMNITGGRRLAIRVAAASPLAVAAEKE